MTQREFRESYKGLGFDIVVEDDFVMLVALKDGEPWDFLTIE